MNNENQISASFFDDEEGLFRFMKPNPKHQELFSDLFILKDQATCKCLASQGTKQGVFALYSHFIVFYEVKTSIKSTLKLYRMPIQTLLRLSLISIILA